MATSRNKENDTVGLLFSPDADLARRTFGNLTVAQTIVTSDVVSLGMKREYNYHSEMNEDNCKYLIPTYVEVTYARNSADLQHNVDWTVTHVMLYGNYTDEDGVSEGREGAIRYGSLASVREAGLIGLADWILTQSQFALPKAN